jgi:hypothetical protein
LRADVVALAVILAFIASIRIWLRANESAPNRGLATLLMLANRYKFPAIGSIANSNQLRGAEMGGGPRPMGFFGRSVPT